MASLTEPGPDDCYLNLGCGSGTLLVERAALGPASRLIGCDLDPGAIACASKNIGAAGTSAELYPWDATATPLPDASVTVLVADLPFGQLVGSHRDNTRLYPAILAEAARLAKPAARFVAITQQVNLFERSLRDARRWWRLDRVVRIRLSSNTVPLHPRVYVLQRSA
jgi:tRNA (guanine6-N2)-methyltransferase